MHHYNTAIELIERAESNYDERMDVILLNLEAAKKAKRSCAIEVSVHLISV